MNNQKNRAWAKHLLFISRVKLIYARITLTRYTTLYFFLALLSCFTLVVLQSSTFASNTEGASAVAAFLSESNVTTKDFGLSFLEDGNVMLCQNIPGQLGADCITLVERAHAHMHVRDIALPQDPQKCAVSLMWFADVLNDARREDLVILAYQIWLFSLSVVTLLNESLPHLFAGLAARALATGWAGFRVQGDKNLYSVYQNVIQAGACGGYDPMGTWWNGDAQHGIAGLVSNVLTLVMMAALSYKLYKVYANQTFSRVGTSAEIHRIYKLVLLLSVSLQLAGFFTLAQTALWIDKISFGPIRPLAQHFPLYLAGFILTVFLEMPWLILGWISVRRESKTLFVLFFLTSSVLFALAILLFISPLYRFVLSEWSFYATMSGTADALLVLTSVLAVVCRLHFGKGLAHFLRVCADLEGEDFTPVYFSKKGDDDDPDYDFKDKNNSEFNAAEIPILHFSSGEQVQRHEPPLERKPSRISLFFSNSQSPNDTIKLSSTPDLYQSAMQFKSPAPVLVQPVARSSSKSSSIHSTRQATRPPDILTGPASPSVLPPISVSPISFEYPRAERPGQARAMAEPTKPAQAVVRSTSMPRRGVPAGGYGLPRRPSDRAKGNGNYF